MARLAPARVAVAVFLLAAAWSARAESGAGSAEAPIATAKVSYVSSSAVYVDAGREEGVREGDVLELLRDGQPAATLKVTDLSSHRAACTVSDPAFVVAVGDIVRFRPAAPSPAASATSTGKPPGAPKRNGKSWARAAGLRGRVGVRYLWVRDGNGTEFSQPALDFKLDGRRVGGGPFDFAVDVRARRTSQTFASGATASDGQNRVYRAFAAWNARESGFRVSLGRQVSPSLATISLFDGLAVELDGSRFAIGGLTGSQPDPVSYRTSSEIRDHGAYFRVHNLPDEKRFWSFTTGLIGSYSHGEINREFVYLQGQYVGPKVMGSVAQEIDYNRGWRSDAGESTVSPTSTFASVRLRATPHLDLDGGFDNRRSVRLYRDRVTPETEFDDAYRRGVWVGATTRFAERYSVGVDARTHGGGDAGSTQSYGLRLQADRITRLGLGVRSRSTKYAGDQFDGWLQSLSVGMTPTQTIHFEITGGVREETHANAPMLDGRLRWVALDLDVALGRHFYLLFSGESDAGDLASTKQGYVGLTYRF